MRLQAFAIVTGYSYTPFCILALGAFRPLYWPCVVVGNLWMIVILGYALRDGLGYQSRSTWLVAFGSVVLLAISQYALSVVNDFVHP